MTVSDFYVGQRVTHRSQWRRPDARVRHGTVLAVDGAVEVAFDGERGHGVFDDKWFEWAKSHLVELAPA